ncbi:MBL fold metallo-hydrolase [Pleionea litopenaei]|uniref:MBL fold metallo-hydrolase n=1 Tax=Pleionea litopenaei TaxID=3070815 RepID=A0AA51RSY9_9GAMM|nr:MBL fold metallo-hydrolase [Pleionea sp. HL-JVS1]WMS87093.1 MBL fold metallo-hydrolase [Pleionea sp. HL-JVS1]
MKTHHLYHSGTHRWLFFGRDPDKKNNIIDTNQYLITTPKRAVLLDPGGIELFSQMLTAVLQHIDLPQLTDLFASHQDPDIISSLGLWDQCLENATLHAPWLWEGFIRHFGMNSIKYNPLPDEGGQLDLNGITLQFIPAHYLHSSGNFHVYDATAKILMSGDIGAALDDTSAPIFVEDFEQHIPKMEYFHQRWMPSNAAKNDWIKRVRQLDIEYMAPQHGAIFKGSMVHKFLDWFEQLEVGVAIASN